MDVLVRISIFILSVMIGIEALEALGFSSSQISIISFEQFSFNSFFIFTALFTSAEIGLLLIAKKTNLVKSTSKA